MATEQMFCRRKYQSGTAVPGFADGQPRTHRFGERSEIEDHSVHKAKAPRFRWRSTRATATA